MRLSDDGRVQAAIGGDGPWTAVEHHETVGSTNDVALGALREGAALGLVVVADRQTAGRGRAGRTWTDDVAGRSGPGNLAITATVRPPATGLGLVPLATGLAVATAYAAQGAEAQLKWPNDVLLGGRKAAGILVERHELPGGPALLIGCGLDLDWRGVPRDGDATAWTSLAEATGRDVDRGAVLTNLLAALGARLTQVAADPAALRADYLGVCSTIGAEVHAALPGGATLTGTALGIDDDGRLRIDTDHELVSVTAGDVTHLRLA